MEEAVEMDVVQLARQKKQAERLKERLKKLANIERYGYRYCARCRAVKPLKAENFPHTPASVTNPYLHYCHNCIEVMANSMEDES